MQDFSSHAREPGADLLQGRFQGRVAFGNLIRLGLSQAAQQGWQQMIWCDLDFDDWPLGEREVVDSLRAWARPGRRLTMLACNYDGIVRRQARFATWRQRFSHLVDCRVIETNTAGLRPSGLWSPSWVVERVDQDLSVGFAGSDLPRRLIFKERLNERLLRSTPGFAATTLGL
jgi:hypothetical protein